MANDQQIRPPGVSRRALFVAAGAACAGLAAPVAANAKTERRLAGYQDHPKGAQSCISCSRYVPDYLCSVIEGPVSPFGWCLLYAPK